MEENESSLGNGGPNPAEIANSLKRLVEAVKVKQDKPVTSRKQAQKIEKLDPRAVEIKQQQITIKAVEKTPKKIDFTNLPIEKQLVNLARVAVKDTSFSNAKQAKLVNNKLLELKSILETTTPSETIEKLTSFFNQADNWTPEASPYMSVARKAVMQYLYTRTPEQYNVLSAKDLILKAEEQLQDYTDAVDWAVLEKEQPSVISAVRDEEITENYNPFSEFEQLSEGTASKGMEKFIEDWKERAQLVKEADSQKRQAYWNVFTEGRLKNDLKDLESLVRQGKVTNEAVQPWIVSINKYLRARENIRQAGRMGRHERNMISANDIEKNNPGFWKTNPRPKHSFEFSYYMKQGDIDILLQSNGEEIWFKKYLLEKTASPRGEAQPTFRQGIQLEEVEDFLEWKYGEAEGLTRKLEMRRKRFGVEHAHQLNKMFTQEGLSAEKMLEFYMQLTPDDLNFLHEFKLVNKAIPIYEYVILTLLSERRARWFQLRDGNRKLGILSKLEREKRIAELERRLNLTPEVVEFKKKELETLQNQSGGVKSEKDRKRVEELEKEIESASGRRRYGLKHASDDQLELARLKEEKDELGYGVALWASDWDFNAHEFDRLRTKWNRIKELQQLSNRTAAEEHELEELNADQIEFDSLVNTRSRTLEQQNRLSQLKERINSEQEIINNQGLSALEIKTKKIMLFQREMEYREQLQPHWKGTESELTEYVKNKLKDKELIMDVHMAILMARYDFVYTRHVVAIAGNYRIVGDGGVKAVMRAPVLEDLERVYAWQTFFKRFSMGGEAGETAMAIYNREAQFHKYGYKLKLSESKLWDHLADSADKHPEQRATMDAIKIWEEKTGISFAQVLNNEGLKGGGVYDASIWRAEIGITDKMRESLISFVEDLRARAQALGRTGVVDNAGLAFQFAAADKTTTEGISKRLYFLEKMRRRDPLLFMEYMAEKRYKLLLSDSFVSASGEPLVDFEILSQALSLANNKINLNKELLIAPDIDLRGKDFHRFVEPYVKQLFKEYGVSGNITTYHEFIKEMMKIAESKFPEWAKIDFPLTLRMGDLDWTDTDYHKAGTLSMARRGRDNVGMYKAAAIMRELKSNHELMFHPDPNKVIDKLLEMEKEMIGYTGNKDAVQAFTDELATYVRMNEFRTRRTFGWAPGGIIEWGLRQLTEVREETIEKGVNLIPNFMFSLLRAKAKNIMTFEEARERFPKETENMSDKNLRKFCKRISNQEHIKKIRHGIVKKLNGNLVSYAVEYGSAHGNAFDEKNIAKIIATAQDRGGFIGDKHLAHNLMSEFKVTLPYRILASVRRVYWVAFVAVLSLAVASAMKDEEKHR